MDSIVVLEYQKNFADNLSVYAYGKILEKIAGKKCCYKNHTSEREKFEDLMSNFNLKCEYISDWRIKDADLNTFFDYKKILKLKNNSKIRTASLNTGHFKIDDIPSISTDIKDSLKFSCLDFVKSHDILENITENQSVGVYINDYDFQNSKIDFAYIKKAYARLNKYLKKPKLFIFSKSPLKKYFEKEVENFEIIDLYDFKEEFYFLCSCRHKIILDSPNSYSAAFWAAILGNKDYSYTIYSKHHKTGYSNPRWISV